MLLVLLQITIGFIDLCHEVVLVFVESLHLVVDDVGCAFDLVLGVFDVLLVFLDAMDVEQIVFL